MTELAIEFLELLRDYRQKEINCINETIEELKKLEAEKDENEDL